MNTWGGRGELTSTADVPAPWDGIARRLPLPCSVLLGDGLPAGGAGGGTGQVALFLSGTVLPSFSTIALGLAPGLTLKAVPAAGEAGRGAELPAML